MHDSWGGAGSNETPQVVSVDNLRHVAFIASISDADYPSAAGSRAFLSTYNMTSSELIRQQKFHPTIPNNDRPTALLSHPLTPRLVIASLLPSRDTYVSVIDWLNDPLGGTSFDL